MQFFADHFVLYFFANIYINFIPFVAVNSIYKCIDCLVFLLQCRVLSRFFIGYRRYSQFCFGASLYYDSLFRNGIYSQILFLQAMARTFFNCRTICFALYVFLLKVISIWFSFIITAMLSDIVPHFIHRCLSKCSHESCSNALEPFAMLIQNDSHSDSSMQQSNFAI